MFLHVFGNSDLFLCFSGSPRGALNNLTFEVVLIFLIDFGTPPVIFGLGRLSCLRKGGAPKSPAKSQNGQTQIRTT